MREFRVLVVTQEEVVERLKGHFLDLLAEPGQAERYLKGEATLPNLSKMGTKELASLALECDLFRGEQHSREDCRMVLMSTRNSPSFDRISQPNPDDPVEFPISFDLYRSGVLLSHHSVRTKEERESVLCSARRTYGDSIVKRNEVIR